VNWNCDSLGLILLVWTGQESKHVGGSEECGRPLIFWSIGCNVLRMDQRASKMSRDTFFARILGRIVVEFASSCFFAIVFQSYVHCDSTRYEKQRRIIRFTVATPLACMTYG
jgi:hypothetical protein